MRRLLSTLCAVALSAAGFAAFATTGQDDGGLIAYELYDLN